MNLYVTPYYQGNGNNKIDVEYKNISSKNQILLIIIFMYTFIYLVCLLEKNLINI